MKTALIGLVFLILPHLAAWADDLDVLADPNSSVAECQRAYEKLTHADFASIASKLAMLMGGPVELPSGVLSIGDLKLVYSPPKLPFPALIDALGPRPPPLWTLGNLWRYQLNAFKPRRRSLPILLPIVESHGLGRDGRFIALSEIDSILSFEADDTDPSLPPLEDTLRHLDVLAKDAHETVPFRRELVTILYREGDPNRYLDLAIELSSRESVPVTELQQFVWCT